MKQDNKFYQAWCVFDMLNCLVSSYFYALIACLDHQTTKKSYTGVVIYFETVFAISFVLNFFIEFYPDGSTIPVRNMRQIAFRYIQNEFVFDLIPLIPLPNLFRGGRDYHWYMVKIIRLSKCERLFNTTKIMNQFKLHKKVQIERELKKNPHLGDDMDSNLINITQLILIG